MRKKTIRRLPPLGRELARVQNDLASVKRRMDRLIRQACEAELLAEATRNRLAGNNPGHPDEWCGNDCACFRKGRERDHWRP
jgi:transposase